MHQLTNITRHPLLIKHQEFGQWHYHRDNAHHTSFIYTPLDFISDRTINDIQSLLSSESYIADNQLRVDLKEIIPLRERLNIFEDEKNQLQHLFKNALIQQPYLTI